MYIVQDRYMCKKHLVYCLIYESQKKLHHFKTKYANVFCRDKGQLFSEWIYDYEVIVFPKMQTKNCRDFCPV